MSRARCSSVGTNVVSVIPSGPQMRSASTASRLLPVTRSTTIPSQSVLMP
jgi:hypothetical protein